MIELDGLGFRYHGSNENALTELNLRVEEGEFLLVVGESGSGKSTLARLMAGLLGPEDGEIRGSMKIDGLEISKNGLPATGMVGLVQQDPESQMVTLKVDDEVAFGPENLGLSTSEIEERVGWAIRSVGAENLRERDTSTLSGGEMQRVAIASILAMLPRVLVLDEPTSSLDPHCAWGIADVLSDLNSRGMTVIVIEHRCQWIASSVTSTVCLENGRLRREEGQRASSQAVTRRPSRASAGAAVLSVVDVSLDYEGRVILDGISLDVRPGEIIGLMGDNGSGKTTLLHLVAGFLTPSRGHILLQGRAGEPTSQMARELGIVFQNPNHQILESSVRDELSFGPRNFRMPIGVFSPAVEGMLDELDLRRYSERSPHKLSLGEKRRVNVGSVAVYGPTLYLLDEPFVGQDLANVAKIMDLVERRAGLGASCIVATHDSDVAMSRCDRIAFLRDANLAYFGPPSEVFRRLEEDGEEWYLPTGWGNS